MPTRRTALQLLGGGVAVSAAPAAFGQNLSPRIRRNVNQVQATHPAIAKYADAVRALRAAPAPKNWDTLARIHQDRCPHGNWFFLPWHRAYLHYFERLCGQAIGDPNFALPYWDWGARLAIPAPFLDTSSPLHHARDRTTLVSAPSFAAQTLDRILRTPDFNVFASKFGAVAASTQSHRRERAARERPT